MSSGDRRQETPFLLGCRPLLRRMVHLGLPTALSNVWAFFFQRKLDTGPVHRFASEFRRFTLISALQSPDSPVQLFWRDGIADADQFAGFDLYPS